MEELRLPWSSKEGILFGCVIALLSSLIIGGYNLYFNVGYGTDRFLEFLRDLLIAWPIVFVIAFILSNTVVGWIASRFVHRFMAPTDSANTYICFNLIMCVLLMSMSMTFLGGLTGHAVAYLMSGEPIDVMELIETWPAIWPRNFCVAFWVEMLIAQPAARRVMVMIHKKKIANAGGVGNGCE